MSAFGVQAQPTESAREKVNITLREEARSRVG
jgi:hypothetical protein